MNHHILRKALQSVPPVRKDGRDLTEFRGVMVDLGCRVGQCTIRIGKTSVRATVTGEIVCPSPDRPNEGRVFFVVENSQLDTLASEGTRPSLEVVAVCNFVEKIVRGSKSFDPESLCILSGRSVWSIRCDIHILNSDGALADACTVAALCALGHFRHETIETQGSGATLADGLDREKVPFQLHHIPVSSTFALIETVDDLVVIADPTEGEESCSQGSVCIAVNQHGELCGISKTGGTVITSDIITHLFDLSLQRAKCLSRTILKGGMDGSMS